MNKFYILYVTLLLITTNSIIFAEDTALPQQKVGTVSAGNPCGTESLPQQKVGTAESLPSFSKEQYIESAREKKILKISLMDCITMALKKNSEIRIRRIDPQLRKDDVKIAESAFEPTFGINYLLNDNTQISTIPFITGNITNQTRSTTLNGTITGKLYPGTRYEVELLTSIYKSDSRYQDINPAYSAEPKITISQPILRNFGTTINRAPIVIAKNIQNITDENFKDTVMEVISLTKITYYNYIFSIKNYSITRASLKRTRDLLIINKARYKKGLISSVDLLETESALAQKIKALITAESSVKSAEDNLKLVTNMVDDPSIWNARLELTDMPVFNFQKLDIVKSLQNAFQFRPDYQAQRIDLENKDVRIKVTKNALLPTLDLIGSFGLNGLAGSYSDAFQSISSQYKDWGAGAQLSIPWGGGERADHEKSQFEKKQALLTFKRLEQRIIFAVRDRVRDVDIQYRQVNASKIAKQRENKNYKAQRERYSAGQVSTHDILDYQDKFAQSELDYIKALIDYNIALINLDKAEGITLASNNIKLEETYE